MEEEACKLCFSRPAIKSSHIIPAFVFRAIKSDSPTGRFRNPNRPNIPIQDGDKLPLLCPKCEQLFGDAEREFSSKIFCPFQTSDKDQFEYGPWLHYFMTSLAWRTLILDLPGLEADMANPRPSVMRLRSVSELMRLYLLGANSKARDLRNHVVAWTRMTSACACLAAIGPNAMIRRSVYGFTVLHRSLGYSAVINNLAGFMCLFIVKANPSDIWRGTKVNPVGGRIKQPQRFKSWLIEELLTTLVEAAEDCSAMSESQRKKVRGAVAENLSAKGLRFREWDKHIDITD